MFSTISVLPVLFYSTMISTVIPFLYNQKRKYFGKTTKYLNMELCLESLVASSLIKEVILVNQGPENFLKHFEGGKVRVLNVDYPGPLNQSFLLNAGLQAASGAFFMRHDIDCVLNPDFDSLVQPYLGDTVVHQRLIGNLIQDEAQYGPSHASFLLLQERNQKWFKFCRKLDWSQFSFPEFMEEFTQNCPDANINYLTSHVICPTKLLEKLRGYDEDFDGWGYQDTDLNNRFSAAGARHISPPELCVLHQPHTLKTVVMPEYTKNHVKARILTDYNLFNNVVRPGRKDPRVIEWIDSYLFGSSLQYEGELFDGYIDYLEQILSKADRERPNKTRVFYEVVRKYYQDHGLLVDFSYQDFKKSDLLFNRKRRSGTVFWNVFDEIYKLRLYYQSLTTC